MKYLATSTIAKKLKTLKFSENRRTGHFIRCLGSPSQFMAIKIPELPGNIEVTDARWTKRGNVHIISYWSYPSTLKELEEFVTDMKETYSELCGINWQ